MLFIQLLWVKPVYFFMVCVIVTFSICLHEYCHALIAVREGDYTASDRLTLNPFRQMGFMSILMLAFFGIAWGSVPVDRSLLRSRWSDLKISLAGPCANFGLFLLGALLYGLSRRFAGGQELDILRQFLALFGIYNFVLLVFNMFPAPGLDGWHVLAALFPKLKTVSSEVVKGFMLFVLLLAFLGVGVLYTAGAVCVGAIASLIGGGA